VTVAVTPDAFKKTLLTLLFSLGISLRFFSQPEVLALIAELSRKLGVSLNGDNIKKLVLDDMKAKRNS